MPGAARATRCSCYSSRTLNGDTPSWQRVRAVRSKRRQAWQLLAETCTPDGSTVRLSVRDGEYVISVDGDTLMSSHTHGSEEALATVACQGLPVSPRPRVLVGGLGMGFTLRAALDRLPPSAIVTVAELLPAVVEWNRGPLAPLAGFPLGDRRVQVKSGEDVGFTLRANTDRFDAILLDVDNGPTAFTATTNHGLYGNAGVDAAYAALRVGGTLAVWSAWEDRKFEQRLRFHRFSTEVNRVRARLKQGGRWHTIFRGVKAPGPQNRATGLRARGA